MSLIWQCNHSTTSFPQRGADGIDYCSCLECGAVIISPIQFAGSAANDDSVGDGGASEWIDVCRSLTPYVVIVGFVLLMVLIGGGNG